MKNLYIVIILILGISSQIFAGGPWPQPKGQGYFKLSEYWIVFDQHYTDNGLLDPNVTTGIFNTNLYGEYGLTDKFTLLANATLFSRNYVNNLRSGTTRELLIPGDAINNIGDIDLGIKYGLTKPNAKLPVALSLILGIPTGVASGGLANNLQTGDGEFNQILQVDSGFGFKLGSLSAYTSGYIGFNNRSKGFSEELRYGIELGIGAFNKRLWVTGKLNVVESLKNGFTAETITSTSIFANNSEFTSLALEANVYLTKKIGISAGIGTALRGEIIAAAPSFSIGIFYDMK